MINAWRIWLWVNDASSQRFYNGTDTRIDSILWGCALALGLPILEKQFRRIPQVVASLLLATLMGLSFIFDVKNMTHLLATFTVVPPLVCLMIGIATTQRIKYLEAKVLVGLGKVSYGFYLWHLPVLIFCGSRQWPPMKILAGYLLGAAIMTMISYLFIERPFLALKNRLPLRPDRGLQAVEH